MTATTQRQRALQSANQWKDAKYAVKRELADLSRPSAMNYLAGLIEADDRAALSFRLAEAVRAIPRLGDSSVAAYVHAAGALTGDKRIRDLTERQRGALARYLRERAGDADCPPPPERNLAPVKPAPSLTSRPAPTRGASKDRADRLFAAIREHRRNVASPTLPAEAFATADEDLYRTAREIMGLTRARAA